MQTPWTKLSGQSGKPDTIKCYTVPELRKIASALVKKEECDTLLKITNKQLRLKMEILADQDAQLVILNKESNLKEKIIGEKDLKIQSLTADLKKSERQKKWLKFGWVSTSCVFAATFIFLLIK